ncbi:PadR family transcriptional regulator [Thermococcus aggregans]|uniref:PadR family transcriptional regulator n=1 Tax=Thermococcus aggregans TaxID=110163 RepID=A0A9E7MW58_THEAG|nr:PadR family transcriptional regulator [Thermococcus aggregans]USS39919.1 PadR family transcriptional regulator [Thermococcus aggregans]
MFGNPKKKALEKFRKEIRTGIYAYLVLSFLEKEKTHGYALRKTFEELSNGEFMPSESTLYRILRTLEKYGLIKGEWEEVRGRVRKYYEITQSGKEVLEELRKEIELVKKVLENSF